MNGWTFWIERDDGRFQMVDVFMPDFNKAEAAVIEYVGNGKVDSYTFRADEWMRKHYKRVGTVKTVIDGNRVPKRGAVKRGSRADTLAARSS